MPFYLGQVKKGEDPVDYLELTDAEYEEFCACEEALKIRNSQLREEGETLFSELKAGALSFDKKFGDQFYRMVVKRWDGCPNRRIYTAYQARAHFWV